MYKIEVEEIMKKVEDELKKKDRVILGIDGCGGSGKSTLGKEISKDDRVTLIHSDDFYKISEERKNVIDVEDGGNYDLERLLEEIIIPYKKKDKVIYNKYNWVENYVEKGLEIEEKKILVIEGVYTLPDKLRDYFDVKVWVECNYDKRLSRGIERDGENMRSMWVDEWMVLEERYIKNQNPNKIVDFIINGE